MRAIITWIQRNTRDFTLARFPSPVDRPPLPCCRCNFRLLGAQPSFSGKSGTIVLGASDIAVSAYSLAHYKLARLSSCLQAFLFCFSPPHFGSPSFSAPLCPSSNLTFIFTAFHRFIQRFEDYSFEHGSSRNGK
jgi:hypothetical protein